MKTGATQANTSGAAAPVQSVEQLRYARWLEIGTRAGLGLLVLLFLAYASGLTTPQMPHERLPQVWGLPVGEFLQATGMPVGWDWLALAHRGDIANLLGIALLIGCSLPPLLGLVPLYAARGNRIYIGICLAEVAVILLAASGVLSAGH